MIYNEICASEDLSNEYSAPKFTADRASCDAPSVEIMMFCKVRRSPEGLWSQCTRLRFDHQSPDRSGSPDLSDAARRLAKRIRPNMTLTRNNTPNIMRKHAWQAQATRGTQWLSGEQYVDQIYLRRPVFKPNPEITLHKNLRVYFASQGFDDVFGFAR